MFVKLKNKNHYGGGFLCYIPFPDNDSKFQTLITCNHILGENEF